MWQKYQALGKDDKLAYFGNRQRFMNTLLTHFDREGPYKFVIKRTIVDLIGSFFFHPDDVLVSQALAIFKDVPGNDDQVAIVPKHILFSIL